MLGKYEQDGRILEMAAYLPSNRSGQFETYNYRGAAPACAKAGMRLATAAETAWLGPLVSALAAREGEVWIAADDTCRFPYFANGRGQAEIACESAFGEALPFVKDRPAICVPAGGPVPNLPMP